MFLKQQPRCVLIMQEGLSQNGVSLWLCSLQEKLMYYPVCVNTTKRTEDEGEEGLGSLPRNVSSVSSLLLFNTTENL